MLNNNPTYNDGKGFLDNEGVCTKGISLCNAALKDLATGQYLAFVNKIEQIAQIFANLKTAIKSDRESLEANIEELKRANAALIEQQNTIERKD